MLPNNAAKVPEFYCKSDFFPSYTQLRMCSTKKVKTELLNIARLTLPNSLILDYHIWLVFFFVLYLNNSNVCTLSLFLPPPHTHTHIYKHTTNKNKGMLLSKKNHLLSLARISTTTLPYVNIEQWKAFHSKCHIYKKKIASQTNKFIFITLPLFYLKCSKCGS